MARVLVVDDTEIWREMLEDDLRAARHTVVSVGSAEDALAALEAAAGAFDFALMDQVLMTGGMDGLQATAAIRHRWPVVRVIVMTAYGDGESSRAALRLNAYRYVFRSGDPAEWLADIRRLIESAERLADLERKVGDSFWTQSICLNAEMAMGIVDRSYRILYENEAQKGIAGGGSQTKGICWVEWHGALTQKEPCDWCPIRPIFEDRRSTPRIVPLIRDGGLQYWETGASPIQDADGAIIAAMKWGLDVTEREKAHRAALEAGTLDERLTAALGQIRTWGYARARLYERQAGETSDASDVLVGRLQIGASPPKMEDAQWEVAADSYSADTLASENPRICRRGETGRPPREPALLEAGVTEWLEAPLVTRSGRVVGKISIDNHVDPKDARPDQPPVPRPVTEEHFANLKTMAGYAANALYDTRRSEETERELALQRRLRELDARIAGQLEIKQVLRAVVEAAVELLGADGGSMQLYYDTTRELKVEVSQGLDELDGMTFKYGEGLTGKVVERKTHLVIKDYPAWDERSPQFDHPPLRDRIGSAIGAPILQQDQPLGVVSVFARPRGRVFTEHDARLLKTLADRAAIAIQNARLYRETAVLYAASKAISESRLLDEALERIWRATKEFIPADSALLFKWDGQKLTVGGSFAYDKAHLGQHEFTFGRGEGFPGRIVEICQPLLVSDVPASVDLRPKYPEMNNGRPLGSFVGVPLIVRDALTGVFALTSAERGAFTEEHLRLLQKLAEQIAIAVEQGRLFEETERRAEELARLNRQLERRNEQLAAIAEVAAAMRGEDNPQTVIRIALTGMTARPGLSFSRAIYLQVDATGRELHGAAAIGGLTEPEAHDNWRASDALSNLADYIASARAWASEPRGELDRVARDLRIPLDGEIGLLRLCFFRGEAFMVSEPAAAAHATGPLARLGLEAHALVPFIAKERPLGVLIVDNKFLATPITPDDLGMIQTLAAQGAVAFDNARLIAGQRETFGDIAHQLISPVQTVQGFSRLLAEGAVKEESSVHEYYEWIATAGENLKGMTDNLMALRYIDTGRFELQREKVSIRDIAHAAIDLYRYAARQKRIRIVTQFAHSDQADALHADKLKLTAVIQNFIENAIKYSPEDTEVVVSTAEHAGCLQISVRDQGRGISPEELPRVFERYWRSPTSKQSAVEGTGIGLAIAQHTAELHGGKTLVESKLGAGSTFTLALPLA